MSKYLRVVLTILGLTIFTFVLPDFLPKEEKYKSLEMVLYTLSGFFLWLFIAVLNYDPPNLPKQLTEQIGNELQELRTEVEELKEEIKILKK